MKATAELIMLAKIKNELSKVHDTVYRSWQGGRIPVKVDQRLKELERMMGFLNEEINFISRSRWKEEDDGDERTRLGVGGPQDFSGGGDSEVPFPP